MKNIFKSLMFVAVAAMTFTACEKDNAENNNNNGTEQKTAITFNAKMADTDTRTYFGAYDEVNGYPTLLTGNEVAKFNSWTSTGGTADANKEATINNGRFTVELGVNNGYTVDAYLPASAWGDVKTNWYENYSYCVVSRDYAFPMEQNPTTTSVDPAAHIFKATTTYNGEDNIDLYFEHQVAYGKMSLRNFAEDVVEKYVLTINGETYVVNATWTTDVWFACEPAEVSEMSVSVVTANGTYTKPLAVSAENTLSFVKGQVSAFGVNMEGVTTGEAVDTFNPDVLLAEPTWEGSYYRFNYTDDSGNNFRIYINSEDRPNNVISVKTYSGCGSTEPNKGQFGAALYDSLGWRTFYASAFTSASTLDVSFADGAYTIILTHSGQTYGYKGMPEGWTAPAEGGNEGGNEGGEEGGNEEPAIDLTGFSECTLTSFTKGAQNFVATITLTDKRYGDEYTFSLADVTGINATNKTLATGEYTFVEDFNSCEMEASGFTYYGSTYNVTGTVTVYNQNGTYTIKCDCKINAYSSIKLYYQGTL